MKFSYPIIFFSSSSLTAFIITLIFFGKCLSFNNDYNLISNNHIINFHDVQNKSDDKFYGKPLITIGVIPFDVNTNTILNQFQVSIGSWLRGTAQIVVYVYDIVGGMGNLAPILIKSLQDEFGENRIFIKGKIIKQHKIETIPEAFERVELDSETIFCAFASNDIILRPDWIDYVYAARSFFGRYHNWSMHFPRRDLFVSCRAQISISNIMNGKESLIQDPTLKSTYMSNMDSNYFEFLKKFATDCRSRLHTVGYDVYFWNHLGINMTKAKLPPYYIGRPNFDSGIIRRQMDQGWFISTYPQHETYHLEHPDRFQYAKKMSHPDSVHNSQLEKENGFHPYKNDHFNLIMNKDKIFLRQKNNTYATYIIEDNTNKADFFPFSNTEYIPSDPL